MDRHPTTVTWQLPPADRPALPAPLVRTNLHALAARPLRFEHHLMIVATVGVAQLEIATASEPLYFAHRNISDEYAVPLPTGDPMLDAFPFRTFFADPDSGDDVGRVKHKTGQLVLHPWGLLHWPGRLRPPYAPFEFAEGMRRAGVTLVYCASRPTEPGDRPLFVSAGNDGATKQYGAAEVPFLLADLLREDSRPVAVIGDTTMELVVDPETIAPPRGGYAVIVAGTGDWMTGDLVYIPAGAELAAAGIERALVVSSADVEPTPPPASWTAAPAPPFAVYEDGAAGSLPIERAGMTVAATDERTVRVTIGESSAEIPRYWLARFLFRTALHGFALGYLETYGGFWYDDGAGGDVRFGLRGGAEVTVARADAGATVEALYRAIAPPGYVERVS